MSKYCSDCEYLKEKDKKCDGVYKCSKNKKYVNAHMPCCDKFSWSYSRSNEDKDKLYELGAKKEKEIPDISIGYIIGWGLILIVLVIASLFGV
ncbi:MAG: hypothetical protein IJ772_01825 [Bacilli bacterium]|nr:hypothetical protein [Bacilli bacterium]